MARKKQEETTQPAPVPKAKKVKADKPATPVKSSKKAKPTQAKRASHPAVEESVVMAAFQGGKSLSKKELLAACGGDDIALTKTIKRLRGEGKIAVKGSTRDAVYSLAA